MEREDMTYVARFGKDILGMPAAEESDEVH